MAGYLFSGGRFLDPRNDELQDGVSVLVEDGTVKEVSDRPIASASATRIDLRGRTLMPGLIDAHIHVVLTEVNLRLLADVPLTLLAAKGSVAMRAMLHARLHHGARHRRRRLRHQGRGRAGPVRGPAPVHRRPADEPDRRPRRAPAAHQSEIECACCSGLPWTGRIADGVPEVIKAMRDELRKGADQIKIMASGGVASQADPLESLQYRIDEIEAAVDEATRWGTYVCAHAYSAKAIERAVTAGVRTIEHGNLIDAPTARADGRARRVSGADAGRLRCAEAPRAGLRTFQLQPGKERTGAACGPALAGASPAPPG